MKAKKRFFKGSQVPGIRIGQLLVEQGALSDVQVEHILRVQKESGRPFGDLAERLFGISPKAVEDAWVEQYIRTTGVIDLTEIEFEKDCLRLLNRRQAWQFHVLPSNREQGELNVATSPEGLVRAVNFATRSLDEPVYFMLAERKQLREFLMKHYPVPEFLAQFSENL
jgi:Type II secretion system (T2SS), protein E, N-terminal domain